MCGRIRQINGVFWEVRKIPGAVWRCTWAWSAGIACRSGGISGSFRQGIECFERRCCDAERRKTDLPH